MEFIWPFFKGQYKVHCSKRDHAKTIGSWSGCVRDAMYFFPDGHIEEDVIVPESRLKNACRLIGIVIDHKISPDSNSVVNKVKMPLLKDNNLQEAKNEISASEQRS